MEADAAPRGSSGVVVQNADAVEDLDGAVIETTWQGQPVFVGGCAKQRSGRRVEPHEVGEAIELGLRIGERIEGGFTGHFGYLSG